MVHIYAYNGILFGHRKEILPFLITWMGLEGIKLSETSQTEKKYYMVSFICGIKKVKLVQTVHGGMVFIRHWGTGGTGELLKGINLQLAQE